MKTKVFILILLSITVFACTKSPEKQIIGVWKGTELSIKNDSIKMDSTVWNENKAAHRNTTYEFFANHNYQVKMNYKGNISVSNGKWHYNDKTKALTVIDTISSTVQDHLIEKINSNQLTLKSVFAFGEITATFEKSK